MDSSYLPSIRKQFAYYKNIGDKVLERVPEDRLTWAPDENSNSLSVLVKHLHGNMLSRWTDFLTSDGEKENRHRDREFENDIASKDELLRRWNEGWQCLFDALDTLREEDLGKIVYIRNLGHTVSDAINRQLAHYPYHVGQMAYMAKMVCGPQWESLSIPKGKSEEFNRKKFAESKKTGHFTDEYLKKDE